MKDSKANSIAPIGPESSTAPTDVEEQIRQRAYQLYEQRPDGPGDWLEPERQVPGSASEKKMQAAA